jgi:simple sugar transport system ATP-binding protein
VQAGTVHGLVGENGAGKSTLMSVLYGFYRADAGAISVFGAEGDIHNADDAIALGIGMVHQHFMLVDTLSALENVMLGAEPHWLLLRAASQVREKLEALMQSTGLHVRLDALVADLSVGDRQRLEILKALYRGAKVLILDEPTAVLTPQETLQLFEVLKGLRAQGTTIILITHKLKEVMGLCDVVTVMRQGRVVQELPIAEASIAGLAEAMVGRKVNMGRVDGEVRPVGDVLLAAKQLEVLDSLQVVRLSGINLELRAGEIVGVAGVSGNGQSELLDVLSGMLAPSQGDLTLGGQPFTPTHWLDPQTARQLGLAHVPEDRHARALVMDFAAWESAVLGYDGLPQYCHGPWMQHGGMQHATTDMMERFDVRPRNPALVSSKFSGGNQQKLVLARELGQGPKVLLVGQPTRGVDIGAIEFIYTQLRAMRDAGCAVLVVSSELDEILALSDRVVVMNQGRIAGELAISQCTEAGLGLLMTGATQ